MGLRIIYGRAGTGKSFYVLNKIGNILKSGKCEPTFLIVPEQFTLQSERNLIKVLDNGGILETEVLSFKRMAHRVFGEVGGLSFPHIHQAGKNVIISNILQKNKENLEVFQGMVAHNGFVNSISTLIKEFKRYNVAPNDLLKYSKGFDFSQKLEELAFIYKEFEDEVKIKYTDSDEDLTMLAKRLSKSKLLESSILWIDEFSSFTPQEMQVLKELLKKAKEVNITLCTDSIFDENEEAVDVFYSVKKTAKNLIKLANEAGVEVEKHVFIDGKTPPRFKESPQIAHLEKNYFAYPAKTLKDKGDSVKIYSCLNIYSEAQNVAKEIMGFIREKGFRYKDIGVVCRNLEAYEKVVSVIFKAHEIPFFIDKKQDVLSHPLVRMILSLFEIITGNWSYEKVFSYLKTSLTDISKEEIDILENYCLACGIRASQWTMEGDWHHNYGLFAISGDESLTDEFYERINDIRRRVVFPILNFSKKAKGRKTPKQIATALYEFLCELNIPDRIEERISFFRESGELSLANEYSQVFGVLMDSLDQLVAVLEDKSIGVETFSKYLMVAFTEYKMGLIPPSLDQVMVGSIERTRSHEVKVLFIIGVNDGVFPTSDFQEGLLSDDERNKLLEKGLELAENTKVKAFEEQFLIYKTLTTPSMYLRLSYSLGDLEGKSMRPSIIISRLKKLFPKIAHHNDLVEKKDFELEELTGKMPTFNRLVYNMRKGLELGEIELEWFDVLSWFLKKEGWKSRCKGISYGLTYNNIPENISKEKAEKLYKTPLYTSVSRVERYSGCPFAYFVEYGLKAKERRIFKVGAPDVGSFLHSAIEEFSKGLSEEGLTWKDFDKDWGKQRVGKIVDGLVSTMLGSSHGRHLRVVSLLKRLERIVNRIVWVISEHIKSGNFDIYGYEMLFGNGGEFPPIKIEVPGGSDVYLTGRIDRVDILEQDDGTFIRIVDYKSGNKKLDMTDVYHGLEIQLVSYLDAICQNTGKKLKEPLLPGGIFYLRLDDPLVKANFNMSDQEIEKEILKNLKMQGVLLADVSLVREMDNDLNGYSRIIPAAINSGDKLGKSSKAIDLEQFDILRGYVKNLLSQISGKILSGDVSLQPYKKKDVNACKFCKFITVCHFDPKLEENNYRIIQQKDDEEIFEMMKC